MSGPSTQSYSRPTVYSAPSSTVSLKTDASTGLANRLVDGAPGANRLVDVATVTYGGREIGTFSSWAAESPSQTIHPSPNYKPGRSQPSTDEVSKLEETTTSSPSIARPAISLSATA